MARQDDVGGDDVVLFRVISRWLRPSSTRRRTLARQQVEVDVVEVRAPCTTAPDNSTTSTATSKRATAPRAPPPMPTTSAVRGCGCRITGSAPMRWWTKAVVSESFAWCMPSSMMRIGRGPPVAVDRHRRLHALLPPQQDLVAVEAREATSNGLTVLSAVIRNATGPTAIMKPAKLGRCRHCTEAGEPTDDSTASAEAASRLPRLPSAGSSTNPPPPTRRWRRGR